MQGVPRIWRPAVRCLWCAYPNDDCCNFCQKCGKPKDHVSLRFTPGKHDLDMNAIEKRLEEVKKLSDNQAYGRQKSQLQRELEEFLCSLPTPKHIEATTPRDILRFLVWKDMRGKTQVHVDNCQYTGGKGRFPCECPMRLAAGTVDSTIGKLRSIFQALGKSPVWDESSLSGNPATHHSIKSYLKSVRWEQARARTPCRQANPLFWDKFKKIIKHIRSRLQDTTLTPIDRYIFARDLAFFSLAFSSGGRTGDLGRLKSVDLIGRPGDQDWLIHQRVGKTLRGKHSRVTPILAMSSPVFCPIANLKFYSATCKALGVHLGSGYLFRPSSSNGCVKDAPFHYQAAYERLRRYMLDLHIFEGETPHSFRSGTAIMLRLLGASKDQVANHVGWQSSRMVDHYTQLEKVLGLPVSPEHTRLDSVDSLDRLCQNFSDRDNLRHFVPVLYD